MTEPPREPFFGYNAKAFAFQFVAGLLILFIVAKPIGRFAANQLCDFTGICTQEQQSRLNVSEHQ